MEKQDGRKETSAPHREERHEVSTELLQEFIIVGLS